MITAVRDIHVVPSGQYWSVKAEGNPMPLGTFQTKTEAMALGITQAREGRVTLVEHGRDGKIQDNRHYNGRYPDIDN